MKVTIEVPATSANLGAGFDILALALDLSNTVTVSRRSDSTVAIDPGGDAPEEWRDPLTNLITRAYMHTCNALSVAQAQRGADFVCVNRIPQGGGLGSSAAAAVAGALAATSLHGKELPTAKLLALITDLEGHSDNAAAALVGGLALCVGGQMPETIAPPKSLRAVVFVPATAVGTKEARELVPQSFSREDAVFNASRVALLVHAFHADSPSLLAAAMQDRWHQTQRSALMPYLPELIGAAISGGAHGAALSGAGGSVLALADTEKTGGVSAAMTKAAKESKVEGTVLVCGLRPTGATVQIEQ